MNSASRHASPFVFLALLASAAFIGCGDDESSSGSGTGGSSSGGASSPASELEEKLSACPVVSQSSDPTAGDCLVGTYEGTTLSGDPCSLELLDGGAYEFTSPALTVSHTPPDDTIFVFGHSSISNYEQVVWKVGDPISTETWYELDFEARFGTGVPEADRKIEIEVTEHGEDSMQSVACLVEL